MNWWDYWWPRYERDDDDGHILWYTIDWKNWLRGFLPGHWLDYRHSREMADIIRRRGQFGDYWVVPPGYTYQVIEKKPSPESADPLNHSETIGVKFTHQDHIKEVH